MWKVLASLFAFLIIMVIIGIGGAFYIFYEYGRDLPDYRQLAAYDPPTVTRVHAGDGRLLAEYATEKRVFVPVGAIPKRVINAFLSAEDQNFYSHPGVDIKAIGRAAVTNAINYSQGKRPVGASTITQQVAKNFLLSNELKLERKIREAILALRIEHAFDKDRILELYLNEIYLGFGSYGVAAASLNYFNKSLDDLTIPEAAYLAALPKAPNNYHPTRKREAAISRRDWVIGRMLDDGHITEEEAEAAYAEPLEVRERSETEVASAAHFAEEVRRELLRQYGERGLYGGGLSVRTSLDPHLQEIAETSLRDGLIAYDRRHGWRGPIAQIDITDVAWPEHLAALELPAGIAPWVPAVVYDVEGKVAEIRFGDGTEGRIPMTEMRWARPWIKGQKVGARPKTPDQVVQPGDVVLVEPVTEDGEGEPYPEGSFGLRQVPDINGAIVALDPHTGRILAMSGGWSYDDSEFNRAMQANRQPGSAFKPIVYLAGLDSGFTPTTLILDAPFVIDQGAGLGKWKPANYTKKFYGPTPMRKGIEKSRNLMTVRLAQTIGMDKIVDYADRFGVIDNMEPVLSMALGAGETTLLRLTTAYAMLVNGGKRIEPSLIDRVQDKAGRTIFRHDQRDCPGCLVEEWHEDLVPELPDMREQIADPASAYQVVSMLQGVVERGTGRRIREIGKPLGGKTGTTNKSQDTWFVGFTPDLAVGVFVGFDEPKPLGPKQTGSNVAAPIFKSFMAEALADQPAIPFRIPPGIRLVRVNGETGQLARSGDKGVILEAFKPDGLPSGERVVIDGGYDPNAGSASVGSVPGGEGLY
ncbi:MAG: penicillin-binding protein 1A [Pseudomonadota bacterium]